MTVSLVRVVPCALSMAFLQGPAGMHVITGRVQDARGLPPARVSLSVCTPEGHGGSACGPPLTLAADGSFRTPPVADGIHFLVAGPSPFARAPDPSIEHGLETVRVSGADLSGVVVRTSRYSLRGRYVMKSDRAGAKWPASVHLVALLVVDGEAYPVGEDGSTGAPNGEFLLENVLGPRVLRAGYQLNGDKWWPWQVLLDGVDVTDTPTDFSLHPNAKLEVVFTQHPARITGRVIDANGTGVTGAWLVCFSADRGLWTDWPSTTTRSQASSDGEFSFATRPGRYLIAAIPPTPYQVRPVWPSFVDLARGAAAVTVGDRGSADVVVHVAK